MNIAHEAPIVGLLTRLAPRPGPQPGSPRRDAGYALIQLARRLTGLTVIATASRPETMAWAHE